MPHPRTPKRGFDVLRDPALNHGTAFSVEEREALGLTGLLPPTVMDIGDQVRRFRENYATRTSDLGRYIYLTDLQERNETLFYRMLVDDLEGLMPIIYTPTVGQACQMYGNIWRRPRGLFLSLNERGRMGEVLGNWPENDVRVIVVTDGERILGLGDLGLSGMGIPVGKLSLYTACAGIAPSQCLPITLDVGTENETLLNDPLYLGLRRHRIRGKEYDDFIGEFMDAVQRRFGKALVQFEDFANHNAFRLLKRYRDTRLVFNDDIQGTAAVALAGIYSALRVSGGTLRDQRFLFAGAGEAATGIGELIVSALRAEGVADADARAKLWFLDSKGLVVASRTDLAEHKAAFAHDHAPVTRLDEAVALLNPTALIGASRSPGMFTPQVLRAMAQRNQRPIVFALSNPTSRSECTAEQAWRETEGRVLFASGSPFPELTDGSRRFRPGQGNNAYIFPGVGLGALFCGASKISEAMFLAAARALADQVGEDDLADGALYPRLRHIREVSVHIAAAVSEVAWSEGLAARPRPEDLPGAIRGSMYDPLYEPLV